MKYAFSRRQLAIPYAIFLILFVILPLLVVIFYAFTNGDGQVSFRNFLAFFGSSKTVGTLLYSVVIAVTTTLICLLIAYPTAYVLAKTNMKSGDALLLLFVLPMWINFTLRITALKEILTLLEGNLALHPFLNTIVGMVYDFLPFMVLPIYNAMCKIDRGLIDAAADLGAGRMDIFRKVVLPLSMPGVISGIIMVFIPSISEFAIADILGGSKILLIGNVIEQEFSLSNNWNLGSGLSIVLMIFIFVSMAVMNKNDAEGEAQILW